MYSWFPDALKPKRVSDFVINYFKNWQKSDEERLYIMILGKWRETKKYDFGTIFFIFKFFTLLEI